MRGRRVFTALLFRLVFCMGDVSAQVVCCARIYMTGYFGIPITIPKTSISVLPVRLFLLCACVCIMPEYVMAALPFAHEIFSVD